MDDTTVITPMFDTKIINLCGGPGIGKSRTAARLFADLKDRNVLCELVQEKAKDLAWQFGGNPGLYTIQPILHAEQLMRQAYSIGKVQFVITDSPTFLPAIYQDSKGYNTREFVRYVMAEFSRQSNININLIRKEGSYVDEGRHLNEEGASRLDDKCVALMDEYDVPYTNWERKDLPTLADWLVNGGGNDCR